MKAITIYQPRASLVAIGAKQYETRSWQTEYRGPIAIHAGLKLINSFPYEFIERAYEALKRRLMGFTHFHELPRGAIIATAELMACHRIVEEPNQHPHYKAKIGIKVYDIVASADERLFGDWQSGRYAWKLDNVQMLSEPVPARGKQGLWEWDEKEHKIS